MLRALTAVLIPLTGRGDTTLGSERVGQAPEQNNSYLIRASGRATLEAMRALSLNTAMEL